MSIYTIIGMICWGITFCLAFIYIILMRKTEASKELLQDSLLIISYPAFIGGAFSFWGLLSIFYAAPIIHLFSNKQNLFWSIIIIFAYIFIAFQFFFGSIQIKNKEILNPFGRFFMIIIYMMTASLIGFLGLMLLSPIAYLLGYKDMFQMLF